MTAPLNWHFPLPRPHTGVPIANGTQGLLLWGDESLNLTMSRAGFWDHRGGTPFSTRTTYGTLRELLEAGDEGALRAIFSGSSGANLFPTQLGGGRLELHFVAWRPHSARLDVHRGELTVIFQALHHDQTAELRVRQLIGEERVDLDWDAELGQAQVRQIPMYDFIAAHLSERGVLPPERWQDLNGGGFLQHLPEDAALAIAWKLTARSLSVTTALATMARPDARLAAIELLHRDTTAEVESTRAWWTDYWNSVPRIRLPDAILQHAIDLGLWKQACMTTPTGVAASLQGPWMEEYQPIPWSNDYHFNINIQMIYGPALPTNRASHLAPLWRMLRRWLPELRRHATAFFGAEDALMLPHSVDDRCQVVGAFWTGTIDHGCTAWIALMAYRHWRYTNEIEILELAWELLNGAFGGYWAMCENHQGRLSLPVTVSPEYGADGMQAWGRDASFQLAAAHALAEALPIAAVALGKPMDPRWEHMARQLPHYTTSEGPLPRITLWRGQDLDESHRHHSHLAAIEPFRTIDPSDPAHRAVIQRTLRRWTDLGAGAWTGWCLPWAAMLCARCEAPDTAISWLHWWASSFTNAGGGTLHDANDAGCSLFGPNWLADAPDRHLPPREIMQMDAAMGAVSAIIELLVQQRREGLAVLPNLPQHWSSCEADGIACEGGFRVGFTVVRRAIREVRVESLRGGELVIRIGRGSWRRITTIAGQRLKLHEDLAQ